MEEKEVNAINPNNNDNINPNNKTNTFNLVIGIATLLIALLGATFAYFSATSGSTENDVTVKSAYVSISYEGGTDIVASNLIPSNEYVVLDKYRKHQEPCSNVDGCEMITENHDQYEVSPEMLDRRCIDANGRQVCSVYQFSVMSEGPEAGNGNDGTTPILGYIKINNNKFENLSYTIFDVTPVYADDGQKVKDKYGFDYLNDSYAIVVGSGGDNDEGVEGFFDKTIDINMMPGWDEDPKWTPSQINDYAFTTFANPKPIINGEGVHQGFTSPVACLFGYDENYEEKEGIDPENDPARCAINNIGNNKLHTYQVVIWLNETGEVQDEQGLTFQGTVAIEVSGGSGGSTEDKITGKE